MPGAAGDIVFLGDPDENVQRVSTVGRGFFSESYTRIKNHSPVNVISASGGTTFDSVDVGKMIIYSESGNNIMWWGGNGDDAPYSGHGMPLWGGERTDLLPVTNFNAIRIFAATSGQIVYAVGFLNGAATELSNTSPIQPDFINPTLVSHSPVSGLSGIQLNESISVTFSEEIAEASIVSGVIKLSPVHTNITFYRDPGDSSTVIVEPGAFLSGATVYTVTVSHSGNTVITDRVGNRLLSGSNHVFPFTTVSGAPPPDTTPPVVSGTSPVSGATGINIDSSVTVTFSEQMLSGTINGTNIYLSLTSGASSANAVAASVSLSAADKKTVTVDPTQSLAVATTYHINVTTGVQDLASNAMASIDRARWFSTSTGSLTEVYNVAGSSEASMWDTDHLGLAIKVTGSCNLLNTVPKKVTLKLRKSGSPTGTATIALLKGATTTHASLTQHVIGTINVATLTSSFVEYTFENLNQTQTITTNERIAILYSGPSSSLNKLVVAYNASGTYANAVLDTLHIDNGGVWTQSVSTHDMVGVVYS
jgi:hypothetical protein